MRAIGANLEKAYLQDVNLIGADLTDTNLAGAYLGGARFIKGHINRR